MTTPTADSVHPDTWNEIHQQVQEILANMDPEIADRVPGVHVTAQTTTGRVWSLFTYRTFSPPSASGIDPVVVGITFSPSDGNYEIQADASGETRGDIIIEIPPRRVAGSRVELLRSARDSAEQLRAAADRIARALVDPTREE